MPAEAAPRIAGFLLVEYIPHTQAIGFEVLIGFREDPAFGPVLTVSKGGDDAEFFAAHYDPANLFLPPMEYPQALAFTRSLHIRYKFEQIGHPEYLELMARAMAGFSSLALAYSPMAVASALCLHGFRGQSLCHLLGRTVRCHRRPRGVRFRGRPEGLEHAGEPVEPRRVLPPRGMAVIGVSSDLSKYNLARDIAELLHELRHGDLFLVNPRGGTLKFGDKEYPLYRDLKELPAPVELAVYAAPAQAAPEFLRSLSGSSVRAVVLIPGVPGLNPVRAVRAGAPGGAARRDPGHGPQLHGGISRRGRRGSGAQHAVHQREAAGGPLLRPGQRGAPHAERRAGRDGDRQASQLPSLAVGGELREQVRREAWETFSRISQRDPSVDVMAVYLEGVDPGEGRAFFDRARESAKPILAYKGGRTEAGARSAASHTASMSGNYSVFRAACEQAGVILAETIEEYYDLIEDVLPPCFPPSPREQGGRGGERRASSPPWALMSCRA